MSAAITPIRPSTRSLPHNLDAEASVLGGVILKPEVLGRLEHLESGAFYDQRHVIIWEALRNLQARGTPIDVVTVETEIEKAGKLDAIGGVTYLGELALRVPTADNVVAYAKILRDHHLVRETAIAASRTVERAFDWQYEADELLGESMADLQQLERGYREQNERLPIITIEDSLDEIDRLARTPVFETPFPELNKMVGFGGLLGGQVYYLAGGTGFGKTSFVATIVRAHAAEGRPALIAFWEMFSGYYTARMAASLVGVPATRILRGGVERASIVSALPRSIEMLDSPSMSTLRRAAERQIKLGHGAPLIVVDYVQLLGERIMATMTRPDPRVAAGMASAGLRELAKSTGAAIIAVSAAGRTASRDLNKDVRKLPARDLVAASRESGSIEFDGAGVIVLSVSEEKDGDEHIATISVAKARFGQTGHIDGRFGGGYGNWREVGRVVPYVKIDTKPDDGAVAAAIVATLRKSSEPMSKNKIHEFSGKGRNAVFSEIDVLVDRKILVAKGRGYVLAEVENQPVPAVLQVAMAEVP